MTWQIPGAVMTGGVFGAGAVGGSVAGTNTGIITASTPFAIAQEWNNAAVLFKAFTIDVTDDASNANSLLVDFRSGGVSRFSIGKFGTTSIEGVNGSLEFPSGGTWPRLSRTSDGGLLLGSNGGSAGAVYFGAADVALSRDASNILAQRVGVNAQGRRNYNTWTDAANGEWLSEQWASNICQVGLTANGTGIVRSLIIGACTPLTVATLPAASAALKNARTMVSDANSVVFNAAAVGGGANIMPVFCNGAGWFIG